LRCWSDLSDVKLARGAERHGDVLSLLRVLDERSDARAHDKALVAGALDKALFEAITAQLKTNAIRVKSGTLVDATIIASASEEDSEARWVKHRGRAAVRGFRGHRGADAEAAAG
jgi:IS5 family transposase